MAIVVRIVEKNLVTLVHVNEEGLVIGRSSKCDVKLNDGYSSSRHCRVFLKDNMVHIEDLDSKNGTYICDSRLAGPSQLFVHQFVKIGYGEVFLYLDEKQMTITELMANQDSSLGGGEKTDIIEWGGKADMTSSIKIGA